ncbi:MAG: hypothetical protein IT428_20130 [Planctomycetaceae bacterium]|nr:hypothetical protein [Planctomycetaceae bacterium]
MPAENDTEGIEYLRREAIDAHLAGDGMRVLHVCMIALDNLSGNNDKRRGLSLVRWAFFLGLLWLLDDWLIYAIDSALEKVDDDSCGGGDTALIRHIAHSIGAPAHLGDRALKSLEVDPDWLTSRSHSIEDVAALSLAIEVFWYHDPHGHRWSEVADRWISAVPEHSLGAATLGALRTRLATQTSFLFTDNKTGAAPEPALLQKMNREEQWLITGWSLYFNLETEALDSFLSGLATKLQVNNAYYIKLFPLFNWGRRFRKPGSHDGQFLSLSRRNLIASRQPADVFRERYKHQFSSAFSKLAQSGFSDASANDRIDCFRTAMVNQIQALRSWDVGRWIESEHMLAVSSLELGARGSLDLARRGVLHAVRSNTVEKPGFYPHLDRSLAILDALNEEGRHSLISELLSAPRVRWNSVNRVFAVVSDAIPESLIGSVAKWSSTFELDEYYSKQRRADSQKAVTGGMR